ncbi:hypothetical protein C483_13068 [Natrialba hulunbeirensis JCM 10989]|uniref:Uncharacterized protein n=1 Tax=Natrialba hulunbeirensis JCM 10989 TaxID=1227493 RepID=L9ZVU1_9EURY|nr:hypothetical protein [Natrialba hulunbeirensis]ELY90444.1 hypothetical protein C483_13068 [Natrialba hulunbeirensis JCM 10989]
MYDKSFGTDWESIDGREEVVERAYALGVAVRLGDTYTDELDRLTNQVETTYDESFVNLAYQKGRDEAANLSSQPPREIWQELVEDQTIIEATETEETDDTLPDAIRGVDIDSPPADSTESLRRPGLLERHRATQGESEDGVQSLFGDGRSIFGRSMAKIRRTQSQPDSQGDDGDGDGDSDGGDESSDTDDASTDESATTDSSSSRQSTTDSNGGNRPSSSSSSSDGSGGSTSGSRSGEGAR